MSKLTEKLLEKRTIYKGRILSLRADTIELPNGEVAFREIVEHSGGAGILVVDKNDTIYLVMQYRYAYNKSILEIPAGKLTIGEDPAYCAIRELQEETGLIAGKCKLIHTIYPTCGYSSEIISIFSATDITHGEINLDEDEFVELVRMPFNKALELVISGEINDAKTVIAIYHYALNNK